MEANAAKRTTSAPIITGRFARTSIHGPSGTASSAPTASPHDDSSATWAELASNTVMATTAEAPNPSPVPYALTAYAPHNHPNAETELCPRRMDAHSPRRTLLHRKVIEADERAPPPTTHRTPCHNAALWR
ncbi:hypothetical protein GCM10023318_19590 [Nocardia callitridis]|uniref:Uncharacterized protein n=1 Tax=Nocardia callitridis TaxID=648753 RepID=A0ABP9K5L3_9NOCA